MPMLFGDGWAFVHRLCHAPGSKLGIFLEEKEKSELTSKLRKKRYTGGLY